MLRAKQYDQTRDLLRIMQANFPGMAANEDLERRLAIASSAGSVPE